MSFWFGVPALAGTPHPDPLPLSRGEGEPSAALLLLVGWQQSPRLLFLPMNLETKASPPRPSPPEEGREKAPALGRFWGSKGESSLRGILSQRLGESRGEGRAFRRFTSSFSNTPGGYPR